MPDVFVGGLSVEAGEVFTSLEAAITGSCELLDMGAGNARPLLGLPYARSY